MHTLDNIKAITLNKQMNAQAQAVINTTSKKKRNLQLQLNVVLEELSELAVAITHFFFRKKITKEQLISEMADAEIMLTQLKYIVCESSEEYTKVLAKKLAKQKHYIDNSTPWSNVNEQIQK